jgi:hypothetical protein
VSSDRKLASNCRNARLSAGPRTVASRARAARNAFRHGLAIPLTRDPVTSPEIERMAAALAGPSPSPYRLEQARIVAESELELRRVRAHRKALLERQAAELAVHRCSEDDRACFEPEQLHGEREAVAVAAALPELEKLERYERRARSRRKRAMRWLAYTRVIIEG